MKILVIQIKRIGDVLLTTPALAALRGQFPQATIDILVDRRWAEVLENLPMVSHVLPYDTEAPLRWLWRVHQARYDWIIDFLGNPRSAVLTWISGASLRAGFRGRGWGWCYTHRIPMPTQPDYSAAHKLRLLEALGVPTQQSGTAVLPTVALTDEDRRVVEQFLQSCGISDGERIIALAPVHRRPSRQWQLDHCVRLGELLVTRWQAKVLWIGAPDEQPQLHLLKGRMQAPSWVVPPIRLRQAAALLTRCDLVVSSDSGIRHLAVAVGTPSVAIHGPALPINWTPPHPSHRAVYAEGLWCLGCDLNQCPYHHECMRWVDAEQVFQVCEELCGGGGHEGLSRGDTRFASSLHGVLAVSDAPVKLCLTPEATPAPSSIFPGSATEAPATQPLDPPPYVVDDRRPLTTVKTSRVLQGVAAISAFGYGIAVKARELTFTAGWIPVRRLSLPTFCVGNLTAGGTGKTPTVIRLVEDLLRWGRRPAVLSRGYGRADSLRRCLAVRDQRGRLRSIQQVGEEPWLIARRFPGVPVVVGSDRARAAHIAIAQAAVDCVVLDDGFQHHRLARDLDIVVINALDPLGGGRLLPAGRLREPPEALARAGLVVLTHVGLVTASDRQAIKGKLAPYLRPHVPIIEAHHEPVTLTPLGGGASPTLRHAVEALRTREVIACSAVGCPEGFEQTLQGLGAVVREAVRFPDHHWMTPREWEAVIRLASPRRWVVLTEKDVFHVPPGAVSSAAHPVFVLGIELVIQQGSDQWEAIIRSCCGAKRSSPVALLA
ncbi:MAG: tetraacyldisaccharide 4'-kinase [Elusimicrobia bacterium]|nr:tetraacyldisaccharide 4'-kinase [Elusimicrobiota bacterium]